VAETQFAEGKVTAELRGAGPKLALFHSLLADRTSFDGVADALAGRFELMIPALPGFPGSQATDGALESVADRMADALLEFAEGDEVMLLGNGYGGFVALQLVIRHPSLVSRLVLADAGACFDEPGREAFRRMAKGAAGGLEAIADIAMRRLFAPDFHAANPDLVAERRTAFLRSDADVVITACHALASMDLRPNLPGVTIPILALVGEKDEATPPTMSRELASLVPNATLVELSDCAHVPQLQAPERFLAAIVPFLS
jgi:3-oxoadipate enol-lactonase